MCEGSLSRHGRRKRRATAPASTRSNALETPGTAALSRPRSTISAGARKYPTCRDGRHHGLLTGDDLARWETPVEAPLTYDYDNYTVAKGGPWSQGPVLLQQLALLRGVTRQPAKCVAAPHRGYLLLRLNLKSSAGSTPSASASRPMIFRLA